MRPPSPHSTNHRPAAHPYASQRKGVHAGRRRRLHDDVPSLCWHLLRTIFLDVYLGNGPLLRNEETLLVCKLPVYVYEYRLHRCGQLHLLNDWAGSLQHVDCDEPTMQF